MDLQFGQYRLMCSQRRLLGPTGPLELSGRAFEILALLLSKPEGVISKDELFDKVWHLVEPFVIGKNVVAHNWFWF